MTTETLPPTLQQAAQAVLDRWNSPKWEWLKQGPTGELMADLHAALALPVEPAYVKSTEQIVASLCPADIAYIDRMQVWQCQSLKPDIEQPAALPDQGMNCAHYRLMINPETGAKYWEQVVTHVAPAQAALPVEPASDHFPFYELKFIMRVLAHKGTAPRADWETARGMALAVFNDWHKITVELTAQPAALPVEPPVAGDPDGAKVARLMGLLDTLPDTTNLANRAVFKAALYQEFGSAALPVEPTPESKA